MSIPLITPIPLGGVRGIESNASFVKSQEYFQAHLAEVFSPELNNAIAAINSTVDQLYYNRAWATGWVSAGIGDTQITTANVPYLSHSFGAYDQGEALNYTFNADGSVMIGRAGYYKVTCRVAYALNGWTTVDPVFTVFNIHASNVVVTAGKLYNSAPDAGEITITTVVKVLSDGDTIRVVWNPIWVNGLPIMLQSGTTISIDRLPSNG
jgi:hypothetical protein